MNELKNFKDQIHKCSRCGICQNACPIYKITGNDCTVSRGQFAMLEGVLKGELKMSKTINRYLDLCLKCGACSKACPSGINTVDIIIAAKSEYYKKHFTEKVISFIQKNIIFKLLPNTINLFIPKKKSKSFEKKVLFFGGCGSKLKGDLAITKILNKLQIEVINPNFDCCGIPAFVRGDLEGFNNAIESYVKILQKYNIKDVIVNCASCEKSLKDYSKWVKNQESKKFLESIRVKNIFSYIREENLSLNLKNKITVTYHKPCNIDNFNNIEWVLKNTKNLDYKEMKDFDKCCGLNGLTKFSEYKILAKLFKAKQQNIISSEANIVLTSCLGCEIVLNTISNCKYKTQDLLSFLAQN